MGKLIYADVSLTDNELQDLYIYPKIRYLAYRLLYLFMQGGFNQTYWEWLLEFSIKEMEAAQLYEKRMILHTLLDVLQINPKIQEEQLNDFLQQFKDVFALFPANYKKLSLKEKMNYLNPNASNFV